MLTPHERERAAILFIREVSADLAQYAAKLSRHGADHARSEPDDVAFIRRAADRIERAMRERDAAAAETKAKQNSGAD